MSEREFEAYLTFLGRSLRLRKDQQESIADELRDHLETRLDELLRAGQARDAAVAQALAEFGDAAVLADQFLFLSRYRHRRFVMRCTLGTTAAAAAVLWLAFAFWPNPHAMPVASVVAQDQPVAEAKPAAKAADDLEMLLDSKRMNAEFVETPLGDVLEFISDAIDTDILIDPSAEDSGVSRDQTITLKITKRQVKIRTVLELILRKLASDVDIVARDGILVITTNANSYVTQIYNVSALVPAKKTVVRTAEGTSGATVVTPEGVITSSPEEQSLVTVITSTIEPSSWQDAGGAGSIQLYDGLLIVKHGSKVHREIRELLLMMQQAKKEGVPARPAGGR